MKMIIAIVNREDAHKVREGLRHAGISHTHLATTGGFRGAGNTTLLIGTEDSQVNEVLNTLRRILQSEETKTNREITLQDNQPSRAVVFVTNVIQFQKL